MTIRLEGVAALNRQLLELGNRSQTGSVLRTAARQGMNKAKERAKATVPVGTRKHKTYKGNIVAPGFAKKSLRVIAFLNRSKTAATALLGVRSEAFYALQFVELGTSKMPRRPWLVPAFEASQDEALREIGNAMRKRIDQILAKRR